MVVAIMGILTGAAAPMFRNSLEGRVLDDAAKQLEDMLRYARSVAVERSAVSRLMFDPETGIVAFSVEIDPLNAPGTFSEELLPSRWNQRTRQKVHITSIQKHVPEGTQEENLIEFQPDGSTAETMIYISDAKERVYTLALLGLTGQVMRWNHFVENFYAP